MAVQQPRGCRSTSEQSRRIRTLPVRSESPQKAAQSVALPANHCLKSYCTSRFALPLFTNIAIYTACRDTKRFNSHSDLSVILPVHETAHSLQLAQLDLQVPDQEKPKRSFSKKNTTLLPLPLLTCMCES